MTAWPKPKVRIKTAKPLRRGPPPKRKKKVEPGNAYNDPEYRKTVEVVHRRSGNWCEYCGRAPRDGDPNHEEYAPFKGKKRVRVPASKMKDACRRCHKLWHKAKDEGKLAEFYAGLQQEAA